MEAKELRVGNLVVDDEGEVVKVENIMSDRYVEWGDCDEYVYFSKENDNDNMFTSIVYSIPLTEEWLLRFGFEINVKLSGLNGFTKDGWFVSNEFDFMTLGSSVILCNVKYVHQLQNLYFALTRNELTISKKTTNFEN